MDFKQHFDRVNQAMGLIKGSDNIGMMFASLGLMTWFRTCGFLHDEKFMQAYHSFRTLVHIPNYQWQLHTVCWAAGNCLHVEGDFVELGVYQGCTTAITADYIGFADAPKRWHLYDTFSGIPEDDLDEGWTNEFYGKDDPDALYESVIELFRAYDNVIVIRGRVPEVLHDTLPDRIAFMHIDLNNATAERAALELAYDRIAPGGMIVFDDYGWTQCTAQMKSADEFIQQHGLRILELPTGQGLFVKPA